MMKRTAQLAAHSSLLAGLLLAAPGAQAEDVQSLTHPICKAGNPISNNYGVADSCTWLEAKIWYDGDTVFGNHRSIPWVEFESDPACQVAVTKGGQSSKISLRDTNFSVLRFDDPPDPDQYYGTALTFKMKLPSGCGLKLETKERSNDMTGSYKDRSIVVPEDYIRGAATKMDFELRHEKATITVN